MDQTWPRPDAYTGQSYLQISHDPVKISAMFLANVEKPLLKGHVEPGGTLSERKTSVEDPPPLPDRPTLQSCWDPADGAVMDRNQQENEVRPLTVEGAATLSERTF